MPVLPPELDPTTRALSGALLGTAVADALGLPFEGVAEGEADLVRADLTRFGLWGRRGFVSDDTQQSALVVESVHEAGQDVVLAAQRFRRALLGWFACLPFGIGFATLRACLRIALG